MAKLADKNVQDSIADFISEAKICAQTKRDENQPHTLGFASMLTVFSVIASVSESAFRKEKILPQFQKFVPEMKDKTSWLVAPKPSPRLSDNRIAEILSRLRNGLTHALSEPSDMMLVGSSTEAVELSKTRPDKFIISTMDFVNAVEETVNKLIAEKPGKKFDPFNKADRDPALAWLAVGLNQPMSVSSQEARSASATKQS
jgi:hypothetical protein